MGILKNKFLVKLIASICLFFTLFNCSVTTKVYADGDDDLGWGGVLINPITNLMVAIGDGIVEILHASIQEQRQAIIKLNGSSEAASAWALFGAIVIGIVAAVAFIAAVIFSAGTVAYIAAAAGIAATFTVGIRHCSYRSCCWNFSGNFSIQRLDTK